MAKQQMCISPCCLWHFADTKTHGFKGYGMVTSKQGVCHTVVLPFKFKSILRQKKNYENSNISSCQNVIFKKSSKRNQNPSRYYNSVSNLKFQLKPKSHLLKILI
jgi:hypothetical protein